MQESQQARWLVPDSAKHMVTLDGEAFWSSIEAWERVSINSLEADGARDAAIIGNEMWEHFEKCSCRLAG